MTPIRVPLRVLYKFAYNLLTESPDPPSGTSPCTLSAGGPVVAVVGCWPLRHCGV